MLFAAALALVIFSSGVLIGYLWRDRISRARRNRKRAARMEREGRGTSSELDVAFSNARSAVRDINPRS